MRPAVLGRDAADLLDQVLRFRRRTGGAKVQAIQRPDELVRRQVPVFGLLGHRLLEEAVHRHRQRRHVLARVGHRGLDLLLHDLAVVRAVERGVARQEGVVGGGQGVEVGGGAGLLAQGLLGGHVPRGAEAVPGVDDVAALEHVAGQAEVAHLHLPVVGEHDVAGLDVAVDDAALVRVAEAFGSGPDDAGRLLGRQAFAGGQVLVQGPAVHQFHDDIVGVVIWTNLVDRDDVRVGQFRGAAGLAQKPLDDALAGLGDVRGQHLDGHRAFQVRVERAVDHAEAAGPEAGLDLEAVDLGADQRVGRLGGGRLGGRRRGLRFVRRRHGRQRIQRRPLLQVEVHRALRRLGGSAFGGRLGRRSRRRGGRPLGGRRRAARLLAMRLGRYPPVAARPADRLGRGVFLPNLIGGPTLGTRHEQMGHESFRTGVRATFPPSGGQTSSAGACPRRTAL